MGRTVFQVLGSVSEWERDNIIDRTRNGRLQRYKEGCWAGGKPPYGYSYDRDSRRLVIDEKEARIVERVFRQYDSGKSLGGVANATPIGASANVVGTAVAAREGYPISWGRYLKFALPAMIVVVGICWLYLIIRYA